MKRFVFWILLILLLVFTKLAIGYSPWFFIGVIFCATYLYINWYFHSGRPWRKCHFPLMMAYSKAAGAELGTAQREGRDVDFNNALRIFLRMINQNLFLADDNFLNGIIDQAFERCRNFHDYPLIRSFLAEKKEFSKEKIDLILQEISKSMDTSNNALMIRMIIAEIIEDQFTVADRGEYMFEVFNGRAS